MRLGFHVRTSAGLIKAALRAIELGCETIQLWSGNPRAWRRTPLDRAEVGRFRELLAEAGINPLFVHLPYLANLAAGDDTLWARTKELLVADLERAVELGAILVAHVGSSSAAPEEVEERIAAAVLSGLERVPVGRLILENMAGQGSQVGSDLRQVARVLDTIGQPGRTGACLDVAHAFAAGWDVATARGINDTLAALGGGERVRLVHLNDSKAPRGSRLDRHAHIGEGHIGREGMRALLTHPLLALTPAVMETPKDAVDADERNMATARALAASRGLAGGTENA